MPFESCFLGHACLMLNPVLGISNATVRKKYQYLATRAKFLLNLAFSDIFGINLYSRVGKSTLLLGAFFL
jgi:hypothetical protein